MGYGISTLAAYIIRASWSKNDRKMNQLNFFFDSLLDRALRTRCRLFV